LPELAPEVKLSVAGEGERVKDAAVRVAVMTGVGAVALMEPAVPETESVRTPLVPGVEVKEMVEVAEPPAASETVAGEAEQVPAAVPVVGAAVQERVTAPAKP